ncbi:MAG: dockerin type I domain-containing protein [Planctomycetota bacterium]
MRSKFRRLRAQSLESRHMLAGDTGHNFVNPGDVNDDGSISQLDALTVINAIRRARASDASDDVSRTEDSFVDVNDDGVTSPGDALNVLNTLRREQRGTNEESVVLQTTTSEGIRIGLVSRGSSDDFEFRIQGADPDRAYRLWMNDQVLGQLTTDSLGRSKINLISGEPASEAVSRGIAGRIGVGAIDVVPITGPLLYTELSGATRIMGRASLSETESVFQLSLNVSGLQPEQTFELTIADATVGQVAANERGEIATMVTFSSDPLGDAFSGSLESLAGASLRVGTTLDGQLISV